MSNQFENSNQNLTNHTSDEDRKSNPGQTPQTSNQGGTQNQDERAEFDRQSNGQKGEQSSSDHKDQERDRSVNWDKERQKFDQRTENQKETEGESDKNEPNESAGTAFFEMDPEKGDQNGNRSRNANDPNYQKDRMREEGANYIPDLGRNQHGPGDDGGAK
jgi:hypothetical protein